MRKLLQNEFMIEERTYQFAKRVRIFARNLPNTITNNEDSKQVVISSGSIGANYIEANESLSKKDFIMRVKICRKESKESAYWIRMIKEINEQFQKTEADFLFNEAVELKKIFSSIIEKSK